MNKVMENKGESGSTSERRVFRSGEGRMDVKGVGGGDGDGADETARQKRKKPWGAGESDKGTRAAELKLNPEWREIKMRG